MSNSYSKFIILAALLLITATAFAQTDFMPVDQIEPGMTGIVRTTFEGTKVEDVQAEVIGILPNLIGPKTDIILVKLRGERVEFQGVASGMSGSPFYINGKLVGALAYRLGNFPKEPIAGVTPIEEMIETQYGGSGAPLGQVDYHQLFARSSDFEILSRRLGFDIKPNFTAYTQTSREGEISPIVTQASHAGIHPAALKLVAPFFRSAGLSLTGAGAVGTSTQEIAGSLEPGMPIAVPLAFGDIFFGSSGTVTHVDGNRVWAYGHPFFQFGNVSFPMARAEMLEVLTSLDGSSNITRTGQVIGSITQDRATAIYGEIGKQATTFDLSVEVKYDGKVVETYNYTIARGSLLSASLIAMAVSNSLSISQGQQGDMTATISGTLEIEGHTDITLNNFYSGNSVIVDVALLPAQVYFFLAENEFEKAQFKKISLSIDLVEELKTATLERAWFTKTELKPNERFKLHMELKPRRGKPIILTQDFFIPETLQSGTYHVTVGNGAAISRQENAMVKGLIKLRDIDHMIRLINTMRGNDRLYAQTYREEEGAYYKGDFFPSLPPTALSVIRSNKADNNFVELTGTVMDERRVKTEYMIEGVKKLTFTVRR